MGTVMAQRWIDHPDPDERELAAFVYAPTPGQVDYWIARRKLVFANIQIYIDNYRWVQQKLDTAVKPSLVSWYRLRSNESLGMLVVYFDEMRLLDRQLRRAGLWSHNMSAADTYVMALEQEISYPSLKRSISGEEPVSTPRPIPDGIETAQPYRQTTQEMDAVHEEILRRTEPLPDTDTNR